MSLGASRVSALRHSEGWSEWDLIASILRTLLLPGRANIGNGIADNILFATHIVSQKVQLGLDMGNYTDYAGATVKYITPAAPVTPIADSELLNHGGVTRPRNIAYPGRIKLI